MGMELRKFLGSFSLYKKICSINKGVYGKMMLFIRCVQRISDDKTIFR